MLHSTTKLNLKVVFGCPVASPVLVSLLSDLDSALKASCGPDFQQHCFPATAQVNRLGRTLTFWKTCSVKTPICKKYHITASSHELMSTRLARIHLKWQWP